jgi:hypothetical protein
MYGGELAVPSPLLTLKAEAAVMQSPSHMADDYVLYVIELERQVGEWVFDGGYAGQQTSDAHGTASTSPERGLANTVIGRASVTLGPRRSATFEAAARQSSHGFYGRGEFSQTYGQHLRLTFAGMIIGGPEDDFIGQFNRNSNATATARVSF